MKPAPNRPRQSREKTEEILRIHNLPLTQVHLVGVRGYFLNSMGKPGVNDLGIPDDCITVCSPDTCVNFNANCDPSIQKVNMANLAPGIMQWKIGTHGNSKPAHMRYEALVQDGDCIVFRPGTAHFAVGAKHPSKGGIHLGAGKWKGMFYINCHKMGDYGTSSLGCQTIWRAQWREFLSLVKAQMKAYGQEKILYVLVENH